MFPHVPSAVTLIPFCLPVYHQQYVPFPPIFSCPQQSLPSLLCPCVCSPVNPLPSVSPRCPQKSLPFPPVSPCTISSHPHSLLYPCVPSAVSPIPSCIPLCHHQSLPFPPVSLCALSNPSNSPHLSMCPQQSLPFPPFSLCALSSHSHSHLSPHVPSAVTHIPSYFPVCPQHSHPYSPVSPVCPQQSLLSPALTTTHLLSVSLNFPVLDLSCKWNHAYVAFVFDFFHLVLFINFNVKWYITLNIVIE